MQTPSRAPRWTLRLFPLPFPHYLSSFNHFDFAQPRARPLVSTTGQYTHSFIPTWFHHPALSLPPLFFLLFFYPFLLPFPPSSPPPSHSLYTERRYTVGSTGPTCCSRVRAITISSRAFFATSRVLTSSLEEEMNWVIVKSCPAVIANACPGPRPATGFLNDRGSVLWSILKRRIVSRYIIVRDTKGFYLGKFYGEFPSWMVIMNRLKRNETILLYSGGKLLKFSVYSFKLSCQILIFSLPILKLYKCVVRIGLDCASLLHCIIPLKTMEMDSRWFKLLCTVRVREFYAVKWRNMGIVGHHATPHGSVYKLRICSG